MQSKQPDISRSTFIGMIMIGLFFDILKVVLTVLLVGVVVNTVLAGIVAGIFWYILNKQGVESPLETLHGIEKGKKLATLWKYLAPYIPLVDVIFGLWSVKVFLMWREQSKKAVEEEAPIAEPEENYATT